MKIPFTNLIKHQNLFGNELNKVVSEVINSADYINGKYNKIFEENFANFLGVKHCIGVGNGTDGLEIALLALKIGRDDEVIVPANSFVATAEAVVNIGAKVVFADCKDDNFNIDPNEIEKKITDKTRCIIPVHLYGCAADMDEIMAIAKKNNLFVIEDAAQAHGAVYKGRNIGSIGNIAVFSFYPGKNLGCYGDGGAVVTNDDVLARQIKMISNHGRIDKYNHIFVGRNSRLDNLQAAVLNVKLKYLKEFNQRRITFAKYYGLQEQSIDFQHVYHLYVIRVKEREKLIEHLSNKGISTGIHYPIGLPFLEAFKYLGHQPEDFPITYKNQSQILSLPMYPELNYNEIDYIRTCLDDKNIN